MVFQVKTPSLPTSLRREGHRAVKRSASVNSCKMSNNVMSYNGAISNRDGVIPDREKVRCGPIQTITQRPHQICKICKLHVYLWNAGTMRVERVNLLKLEVVDVLVYVVSKNHVGKVTQLD